MMDSHHTMYLCDGTVYPGGGGSWIGHVFPGTVFVIWGLHWMLSIYRTYLNRPDSYRAKTWHKLILLDKDWPIEALAKFFFPPIAMLAELYLAHQGGWRYLICPDSTQRAGHLFSNHLNNWQHAAMYPAFIVSGAVDLIALKVDMPEGVQQAYLGLAFFVESLLMGLHKKHEPLDEVVHVLLFYAMLMTCVFVILEIPYPDNVLVSSGRCASILLQGTWFIVVANMMFTGKTMWNTSEGDMAPAMYAPVQFAMCIVFIVCAMLTVYVAMLLLHKYCKHGRLPEKCASHESKGLLDSEKARTIFVKDAD